MPSASSKQHRFMSAVAHNPTFAKKAGVPQSVGKDFAAADKGRKFGRSSRAGINIQNTQHGKMDMPFKSLRRYAGLKGGGEMNQAKMSDKMKMMMQKRVRPAMRPAMAGGMPPGMKKGGMPMIDGKPAFMMKKKPKGGGMHRMPDGEMMKDSAMKKFDRGGITDDNYRQTRQKEIAEKASARAAGIKNKEDAVSKRAYDNAVKMYENELRLDPKDTNPVGYSMRKFEDSVGDKMRSVGKFFGTNRMTSQDDKAQMQAREDVKGYKKGGMPMKDGKPAFMMGKKKMMGGGMAKYAKGGGIESRGKTKGTIIRMA